MTTTMATIYCLVLRAWSHLILSITMKWVYLSSRLLFYCPLHFFKEGGCDQVRLRNLLKITQL